MTTRYLTRHKAERGSHWVLDGKLLSSPSMLGHLLSRPRDYLFSNLDRDQSDVDCDLEILSPIDNGQEVWASGVTYLRSRDARMKESSTGDIYDRVYDADRPELFFKTIGWRCSTNGESIRIRRDSSWNVPEPELVLVLNSRGEIVGYTAGNDVSSRQIEGENPLYLPQAKSYDGSCSIGPGIVLCAPEDLADLEIEMKIHRDNRCIFEGATRTSSMKRSFTELADYLFQEMSFPKGVLLMTGTGIIPKDDFSLASNDEVVIKVGQLELRNTVA